MDKLDPRCKIEFWDKNPEIWKKVVESQKLTDQENKDMVQDFLNLWEGLDANGKVHVGLCADNAEYDFRMANNIVSANTNRSDSIRYSSQGGYRGITDLGDAMWLLKVGEDLKKKVDLFFPHTHNPSDDAAHVILTNYFSEKVLRRLGMDNDLKTKISMILDEEVEKYTRALNPEEVVSS